MHEYDKSSKWLIQHHGDSILRLAGITGFRSWRALQAELVQPRRLPDGLLEVQMAGESEPDLFLLEIATHPEPRLGEQLVRDVMLVYLDRNRLPEVLTLVLHPKGRQLPPAERELTSRLGRTSCRVGWPVINLWEIPAEDLLQAEDVGLVPWVPLSKITGPPEPVLVKCREIIDRGAVPVQRESLLVVTQVLARLQFSDPQVFEILGGKEVMIESPLIQEIVQETIQKNILRVLRARFRSVPEELESELQQVRNDETLSMLIDEAATCPDLDSFRTRLN